MILHWGEGEGLQETEKDGRNGEHDKKTGFAIIIHKITLILKNKLLHTSQIVSFRITHLNNNFQHKT
jgi:hypothetical protein